VRGESGLMARSKDVRVADSAIVGSITVWHDEFTEKMLKKNKKKK